MDKAAMGTHDVEFILDPRCIGTKKCMEFGNDMVNKVFICMCASRPRKQQQQNITGCSNNAVQESPKNLKFGL